MNCPYCSSNLENINTQTKDNQEATLLECNTCGGHWAQATVANNITSTQAANIDAVIPKSNTPTPSQPRCPYCQQRLSPISHDSVAKGVMVWTCPQGHGNFFPYLQLLQFKKAQEAKLTYHTLWGIPLKSLVSVMLPVIAVIAVAGGLPLTLKELQTGQENRTKASSSFTQPVTTQTSNSSALIVFETTTPSTTTLSLFQNNALITQKDISLAPTTRHQIILNDLQPNVPYTYTLTITNSTSNAPLTTQNYSLLLIQNNEQQ